MTGFTIDQVQALLIKEQAALEELRAQQAEVCKIHEDRIAGCQSWLLNFLQHKGSIDQLMLFHFATKGEIEQVSKRHAEEMKALNERAVFVKAWMLDFLNKTNQNSATTDHGVCFKQTATSVTVDPEGGWDRLLDFIFRPAIARFAAVMEQGGTDEQAAAAAREGPELNLLNRSINKTAVMELLEQKEGFHPGLVGAKMASVIQVNVRKS